MVKERLAYEREKEQNSEALQGDQHDKRVDPTTTRHDCFFIRIASQKVTVL